MPVRASRAVQLRLLLVAAAVTIAAACGGKRDDVHDAPASGGSAPAGAIGESTKLGGNVVARVGDTNIDAPTVLAVARAQHLSAESATRTLVDEALLVEAARRNGATTDPRVKQTTTAAMGKVLIARFREEALAR